MIRLKKLKNDKKLWKAKNDDVSTLTIKTSLSSQKCIKISCINTKKNNKKNNLQVKQNVLHVWSPFAR